MTKKHYELIAKVIFDNYTLENRELITRIVKDLADIFKEDNPNFDIQKWVNACMLKVFTSE